MARAKKQHYVPQFYLKRFTDDDEHLWVFDKSTKQSFQTHIRNVASETGFYNLSRGTTGEDEDTQFVENVLSKLEDYFSRVIDLVLETIEENCVLHPLLKKHIARLVCIQLARTRESRNMMTDLAKSLNKSLQDLVAKTTIPDRLQVEYPVSVDEEMVTLAQARLIFDSEFLEEGVQLLKSEYIWTVGVNHTKQPLYTSDNPVVKDRKPGNFPFFTEIAFPLTPKHILVLTHRKVPREPVEFDNKVIPISVKGAMHFNSLQVFQCHRHIYCARKQFTFARHICNKYPEWCRPNRPRMSKPLLYKNIKTPSDNILSDSIVVMHTPLHPNSDFPPSPYISMKDSLERWKLHSEESNN